MTDRETRIKIAESLGWEREFIHGNGVDDYVWVDPEKEKAWIDDGTFSPNFPKLPNT